MVSFQKNRQIGNARNADSSHQALQSMKSLVQSKVKLMLCKSWKQALKTSDYAKRF